MSDIVDDIDVLAGSLLKVLVVDDSQHSTRAIAGRPYSADIKRRAERLPEGSGRRLLRNVAPALGWR